MSAYSSSDPRARRFEKFWNTYIRVVPLRRTLGAQYWESQIGGDPHGFDKFIELRESSYALINEIKKHASGPQSKILDLGCNVGRHLQLLYNTGFTNLHGVDVQRKALEQMKDLFPDMSKISHIESATFQDYLPMVPDKFFEVVFTHGATIELVPPSFPVCKHIARVTSKVVILAIAESGHAYPRFWETEFMWGNFVLVKLLRPVPPDGGVSLMVFRRG